MLQKILIAVFLSLAVICVSADNHDDYKNQLPLVLVHGAAVSGKAWDPVKNLLQGPSVSAPSQRGRNDNMASVDPATVTFKDYIDDISAVVNSVDKGDGVILVGHSFGGLLISQVGENLGPNKIKGLIYVAAYIPDTGIIGDSFGAHLDADTASVIPNWATFDPVAKNWVTINNASAVFLNDCDPNAEQTKTATADIESIKEPTAPFGANVTYGNNFKQIPKYYIATSLDTAVTPGFQQLQYNNFRAGFNKIVTIISGHAPMVCKPQLLADAINPITAAISQQAGVPQATSSASSVVVGGLAIAALLSLFL